MFSVLLDGVESPASGDALTCHKSSFPSFSHDVQIARSYRAEGATSAKREAAEEGKNEDLLLPAAH